MQANAMKLSTLLARGRAIRAIGFDDAPFDHGRSRDVSVAGVVCSATRFEGMVWGRVRQDGWNATDAVLRMLVGGKFLPQLHLVLLDGIEDGSGMGARELELRIFPQYLVGRRDRLRRRQPADQRQRLEPFHLRPAHHYH